MKKTIMVAVLALLSMSAFAQNAKAIYNKYSGQEGVTGVYISGSMFKMMGEMPEIPLGENGTDLTPYIKAMNGFYLLTTPHNDAIAKDAEKLVASGEYEMMMEVKDSGDHVRIFTSKKGNMITGFLILVDDSSEYVFICLDGQISEEDFQKLIAEAMKNS